MAEVFVSFNEPVVDADGTMWRPRACGRESEDGRWEGWVEFDPLDGGDTIRSPRETVQPNRVDLAYWATGLTPVYLEGALARSLRPEPVTVAAPQPPPAFDGPLPPDDPAEPRSGAVLNPFSIYRKGEAVLRRQLGALAAWHLVNIIRAYDLSSLSTAELSALPADELIEMIVSGAGGTERSALDAE